MIIIITIKEDINNNSNHAKLQIPKNTIKTCGTATPAASMSIMMDTTAAIAVHTTNAGSPESKRENSWKMKTGWDARKEQWKINGQMEHPLGKGHIDS